MTTTVISDADSQPDVPLPEGEDFAKSQHIGGSEVASQ
jgi:hypothetical protein